MLKLKKKKKKLLFSQLLPALRSFYAGHINWVTNFNSSPKRLLPQSTLRRINASQPIIIQQRPQEYRNKLPRAGPGIYRQNVQPSQHPANRLLRPILQMMKERLGGFWHISTSTCPAGIQTQVTLCPSQKSTVPLKLGPQTPMELSRIDTDSF